MARKRKNPNKPSSREIASKVAAQNRIKVAERRAEAQIAKVNERLNAPRHGAKNKRAEIERELGLPVSPRGQQKGRRAEGVPQFSEARAEQRVRGIEKRFEAAERRYERAEARVKRITENVQKAKDREVVREDTRKKNAEKSKAAREARKAVTAAKRAVIDAHNARYAGGNYSDNQLQTKRTGTILSSQADYNKVVSNEGEATFMSLKAELRSIKGANGDRLKLGDNGEEGKQQEIIEATRDLMKGRTGDINNKENLAREVRKGLSFKISEAELRKQVRRAQEIEYKNREMAISEVIDDGFGDIDIDDLDNLIF